MFLNILRISASNVLKTFLNILVSFRYIITITITTTITIIIIIMIIININIIIILSFYLACLLKKELRSENVTCN